MAMERAVSESKPIPGDVLHVIGHGPAILLEAVMSGSDIVAYKVRYPDGTQDSVAPEKALICEKRKDDGRSASRQSAGSWSAPEPGDRNEPLMERGVSSSSQPRLTASPGRGPRQLEYLGRALMMKGAISQLLLRPSHWLQPWLVVECCRFLLQ